MWRPDIYQFRTLSKSAQAVTCEVHYLPQQTTIWVTFVYTYNQRGDRKDLWDYLVNQRVGSSTPWMVLGDFNSVLHLEDRIGRNPVTLFEVVDFSTCVEACGMNELPQYGNRYTWTDK